MMLLPFVRCRLVRVRALLIYGAFVFLHFNSHVVESTTIPNDYTNDAGSIRKLSATAAPNVLNVHVVPHTHDDVGWRKTVEQYYYGYNTTLERCGSVNDILTTSVQALTENPSRTFTYVEMKFFSMWWFNQSDSMKDTVRYLIENQQLTFVNGGWCMHDEASTHYIGMIDQTTLGHQFLLQELGVRPVTGWQLDPFGHSSTHAKLLTYAAGMDAVYFGRIDYQDLILRRNESRCEGLWNPTNNPPQSEEADSTIFWGLTGSYGGNYNPPPGFCFDVLCDDEPLVGANMTRLRRRIDDFLHEIKIQSDQTLDNHIMLTFGEDFTFREAHVDFSNIDILIGSVMNYQLWNIINISSIFGPRFDRVNIFYSNPDYYTQQKRISVTKYDAIQWPMKSDDFFPYSDCPHCFWTGYFTSRAALKRYERVASSFLLAARQIDAISPVLRSEKLSDSSMEFRASALYPLEDAVGIAQHHDAVAGTAKQHVADDYSKKLAHGLDIASQSVISQLKQLMLSTDEYESHLENLSYCPLLNETICDVSMLATASNDTIMYVFAYNPLAQNRSAIVRLPVACDDIFQVERVGDEHKRIFSRSVVRDTHLLRNPTKNYELIFDTGILPSIGVVLFRIIKESDHIFMPTNIASTTITKSRRVKKDSKDLIELRNGLISAAFDISTGLLTGISAVGGMVLPVNQTWGYYTSFDSELDSESKSQNSGAYIFRPSIPNQELIHLTPKHGAARFLPTAVGFDVYAFFEEPWVKQVTKIQNDSPYIEIEYIVGPIPINDKRGKEIVTRLTMPINSNGEFFTDSNGREFQKRKRNFRPTWNLDVFEPVAGNYYPVNAAIYIEDDTAALAVMVDRSQGGTSLIDGSIEIMVQRRTLADDSRGVDEPLNETCGGMSPYPPYGTNERIGDGVIIKGKHRVRVGTGRVGASIARSEMDALFAEPLYFVGSTPKSKPIKFRKGSFQALSSSLPPNVMLITFSRLRRNAESSFLLRFGHQYGADEDAIMSKPQIVDLSVFFVDKNITSVVEMTLTGNQDLNTSEDRRIHWSMQKNKEQRRSKPSPLSTQFLISPMEIRTFLVVVNDF